MTGHKKKQKDCCKPLYKPCFGKKEAICNLECFIQELIDCDFLTGLSIGLICDNEIIYQKGFGVRNESGAPFTAETFAQLEYNSLLPLSLYFARLAELGTLCPHTQLVDLGYIPPNTRGANVSTTVVDLMSQAQSYEWLDTELTYLLGYEAEDVLEFLNQRIFSLKHNDHLSRNAFRSFSSKNLPIIQGFLSVLKTKLGGIDIHELILQYLTANGYTDLGYGTTDFVAETNRADGAIRKDCCWVDITNPDNVDNYEGSRGAFSNVGGLLNMVKTILDKGKFGGVQVFDDLALRRYFRENNSRVAIWDAFADPEGKQIPDFDVLKGGGYRVSVAKANLHFIPGITTNGVRSLTSWDPETGFGAVILARGKTAFPEALALYANVLFNQRDPCEAEEAFNFMYRLWNPYIRLNMLGVSCNRPRTSFHRFRKQTVPIPLDGLVFNGGEGRLEMSKVNGEFHGKFGNINEQIRFREVSLDNYCFELIDRNGLKHCGQIQFSYNPELSLVQAQATTTNKRDITYFQEVPQPVVPCNLQAVPLPPLEEDDCCTCWNPCTYGCYPFDDCCHERKSCSQCGDKKDKKKGFCGKCHKDPCCCDYCCKCYKDPCCCYDSYDCNRCGYDPCCCSCRKCGYYPCCCPCYKCKCDPCCCKKKDYCNKCRNDPCCCKCYKCCRTPCCCKQPVCYRLLEEPNCFGGNRKTTNGCADCGDAL